jgi:hypothetical protein
MVAVVQHAMFVVGLGIARDFHPVDDDVVAARKLGRTQNSAGGDHRIDELPKLLTLSKAEAVDERKIEIAHVMVNGSAAGDYAARR